MVGIVILNYNNAGQTLECVASLREHCKGGNWMLCVVDNASPREEEWEKLRNAFADDASVKLLRASQNGGYARGNDLGCEYFDGMPEVDKILILNDDTVFTQDIITPMEKWLDTHTDCGVVFPLVLAPDGSIDPACMRCQKSTFDLFVQATSLGRFGVRRKEFLSPQEATGEYGRVLLVPPGSCMMLPKALFKKMGWLDPATFLYFEEHILTAKLLRMGLKSALMSDISIIHKGAQTTKKQPSKAVYKHWRNSYLYFMRRYSNVPALLQIYLRFRTWLKTIL